MKYALSYVILDFPCIFCTRHDLLMEEDANQVDQLVFCDQKSVAHAAGEFLNMRLFYQGSPDENEELVKSPSRGRKGIFLSWTTCKELRTFGWAHSHYLQKT